DMNPPDRSTPVQDIAPPETLRWGTCAAHRTAFYSDVPAMPSNPPCRRPPDGGDAPHCGRERRRGLTARPSLVPWRRDRRGYWPPASLREDDRRRVGDRTPSPHGLPDAVLQARRLSDGSACRVR